MILDYRYSSSIPDSLKRRTILDDMVMIGIPEKMRRLVRVTITNILASVLEREVGEEVRTVQPSA